MIGLRRFQIADDLGQELERNIPLSEMIQSLRQELQAAMFQGRDQEVQFQVKEVELELQVAVARESQGNAGIKFWVINAGGSHKATEHTTHTFKLKLEPVTRKGNVVQVTDETTKMPR